MTKSAYPLQHNRCSCHTPAVCDRAMIRAGLAESDKPHARAKYLDHGFWIVSERVAREFAATRPAHYAARLPRLGRECLTRSALNGRHYILARTPVHQCAVWSVRTAPCCDLRVPCGKEHGSFFRYPVLSNFEMGAK